MTQPYDALLIVSFGGPEGMDDVMPFLRNVLRGRNVPEERMLEVARHYELFGGISPINQQNRELIAALRTELNQNGVGLPLYWGNRNWHPFLTDTLRQMRDDGIKNALALFTSAFSSYSGCRQYWENIEQARTELGEGAPAIRKLRAFYNHPGFIEPNVAQVRKALEKIPKDRRAGAQIIFTAHSIPMAMAVGCDYHAQLLETCRLVGEQLERSDWRLVFQSRSGPPSQPWLEPDILDHLRSLAEQGVSDLVVAPVGFLSDHMEVIYDLDTEAAKLSEELGLHLVRASTVGSHPRFVRMIRELILEQLDESLPKLALGDRGPGHDVCRIDCCLPGAGRPATSPHAR
jgi:ferrochelatase